MTLKYTVPYEIVLLKAFAALCCVIAFICVCVCLWKLLLSNRTFNWTTVIHKSSDPVSYGFEIYLFIFFFRWVRLPEGRRGNCEWSSEFRNLICIANASRLLTTSRQTLLPSFCEVLCSLCLLQGGQLTVFIFIRKWAPLPIVVHKRGLLPVSYFCTSQW